MKCPQCNKDHKASNGLKCVCGYQFVFDPKSAQAPKFTDGKFLAAYRRASQNGTMYFTTPQHYSAYASHVKSDRVVLFSIGVCAAIVAFFLFWTDTFIFIGACFLAGVFLIAGTFSTPDVINLATFRECVSRWYSRGRTLDKHLTEPTLHNPPPEWDEPDIYDYGVERILIVERDILVDLFVLNGLHASQNMLVLSESGYPDYLVERANQLLQQREDLPVFLLHDATSSGGQMAARLKQQSVFALRRHPVTDIGFTPTHFQSLKRTKNYEIKENDQRNLPVDALQSLFLIEGLSLCFQNGCDYSYVLQEQLKDSSGGNYG